MNTEQIKQVRKAALLLLREVGIAIMAHEEKQLEVVDFGLGAFEEEGLVLLTYINTPRYCAKELIMLPGQTCPEHRHPPVGEDPGKMETFRCRWGDVRLYVEGDPQPRPVLRLPERSATRYTVFQEVALYPGDQYTIPSNTLHWFQAGPKGAIISEFSSTSRDANDVFTDPRIQRLPSQIQ